MQLSIVVLAAGQGKRMRSALPKVLQRLAGKPLLGHVLDVAAALSCDDTVVVYGHGGDQVQAAFPDPELKWAHQAEQLGTGHAVKMAMPSVADDRLALVLCGDVPLLTAPTLERLVEQCADGSVGVLTVDLDDPTGYGRIIRDDEGQVRAIVEQKDASAEQLAVREINSGVICAPSTELRRWLDALSADNAQGEYYLTDIIGAAVADGIPVHAVKGDDPDEVMGINDRRQLAAAECLYQHRYANALLDAGVSLADPARIDVRGSLSAGHDTFIDVNCVFEGDVVLGDRVHIGPGAVIVDSEIGDDTVVHPQCVLEQARVGARCQIGPFARLRPGAEFAEGAKAGNFVEVKKARIGEGSKVNHLTYIGDATIGDKVNVGAGTITCNYDGANKHHTTIGDDAFIGSGVNLVAPVDIGAGATIGAGSTIAKEAPAGKLTLNRAPVKTVDGWKRPVKKNK
ncbi:MAG: bifunctional UDP-N-acetylglucosamine diphosphorylase/glucosamine-1-phosphate N-acetyltransferase GlmU [Pseudomonadota bacterium]